MSAPRQRCVLISLFVASLVLAGGAAKERHALGASDGCLGLR